MLPDCCNCSVACAIFTAAIAWLLYKLIDRHYRSHKADIPSDSRSVLITGCDTGFGRLLAVRMAGKGWCVFAGCLTQKAVDELAGGGGDGNLVPIRMDVSSEESVESAVKKVEQVLSERGIRGLWGVVNNAGVSGRKMGPTEWLNRADFEEVFSVNVYGIVNVTRACLPLMRRLKRSRLVNTSSIFGRIAPAGCAAYCASKYAVQAMSDCYRRELRQFGCHVAILEPGFHRTPMTERASLVRALEKAFEEAPIALKAAYGDNFVRDSMPGLDDMLRMSSHRPENVVDAYEHALTARYPRCRYMVGRDARLFYWPVTLLPEIVGDTLVALRSPRAAQAVA